jgi:hypothetical protein
MTTDEQVRWLRVRMRADLFERFSEMALEAHREPWDQARLILERSARRWRARGTPKTEPEQAA